MENRTTTPVWEMTTKSNIRAVCWINQRQTKDGRSYQEPSVVLERRYQDKDGHWKSTNRFSAQEVLLLTHFMSKVADKVLETRAAGDAA